MRKTTKRFAAITGGLVMAASALTVGTASTASAAASDCPKGWFCVWPKANFKGNMQKVEGNNVNLKQYGGAFANGVGSAYNNGRSCDVAVFEKTWFRGKSDLLKRGYSAPNAKGLPIHSNAWINCS